MPESEEGVQSISPVGVIEVAGWAEGIEVSWEGAILALGGEEVLDDSPGEGAPVNPDCFSDVGGCGIGDEVSKRTYPFKGAGVG